MAMMDFMMRELMQVIQKPMVIIRLGTCGTPRVIPVGSIAVAENCTFLYNNFNGHHLKNGKEKYKFACSLPASKGLMESLCRNLIDKEINVCLGTNVTADTFYSSQGRTDPLFRDNNENLIDTILKKI